MVGTIVHYKLNEYVTVLSGERKIACKWTENLCNKILIGKTAEVKKTEIMHVWEE